ncbi:hypothetical protein AHF37_05165 [Paragonimus kellicotti]|nr:hypothetical protein AHF37_05165 [Paragonimus kellicotti]
MPPPARRGKIQRVHNFLVGYRHRHKKDGTNLIMAHAVGYKRVEKLPGARILLSVLPSPIPLPLPLTNQNVTKYSKIHVDSEVRPWLQNAARSSAYDASITFPGLVTECQEVLSSE